MRIFLVAISLFAGALACFAVVAHARAQQSAVDSSRKAVVVELFTSEGCSSCPPADVLLQKLVSQQPVKGAEIIALEEHVDYWNHDGWTDPYSSGEWTARQQVYSSLDHKDPYTPELVIDGQTQFVGNSPRDAVVAIQDAARAPKMEIEIAETDGDAKQARFKVSAGELTANSEDDSAEVWLAVTEDRLHSSVSHGENAGRTLDHTATLRWLHKIGNANAKGTPPSFSAEPEVKFNSRWKVENLRAVVFVQMKKSRAIVAAASVKIRS